MSDTTKRALETSLKNLLLKKPVNKITINGYYGGLRRKSRNLLLSF